MKTKKILLTICLLYSFTVFSQNKNTADFFDKYENEDDVTTVNISKAMFKLIPVDKVNMNLSENMDISGIFSKIESMRIITSENESMKEKMTAEAKLLVSKNGKYEELMRIKDKKSNVVFNIIKKGNIINELFMVVNNEKSFTAIIISGSFTVEDIREIKKNSDKQ